MPDGTPEPSKNPQLSPQPTGAALLRRYGVRPGVATRLAETHARDEIAAAAAWFDAERRAGRASGPGLLVAALQDGYARPSARAGLLTYAAMLDALHRLGTGARQDAHFEPVPMASGPPMWRRRGGAVSPLRLVSPPAKTRYTRP